tara:strand:+ start:7802 stop:8518 length:717 start_codon:yes stop_codon:yes gene_type:complete
MGLFRIDGEFEKTFEVKNFDTLHQDEWKGEATNDDGINRLEEKGWEDRYEYEAKLIIDIIKANPYIKNVLELGSGPGVLSQKIQKECSGLNYHLVDKPYAKQYFEEKKYKGKFFVKDLASGFNTNGLLEKYDLVITNDFLEHVLNPSTIVQTIYNLTNENSIYFISNPNWRMHHQFIYRGLFDFDNFIYFLYTHKFKLEGFYNSPLQTPDYPRISSETMLPDESLNSWNHYLIFRHRI